MRTDLKSHLCITRPGQEGFLSSELKGLSSSLQCTEIGVGMVELSGVGVEVLFDFPVFFACQLLPEASLVSASSIKSWASLITTQLIANRGDSDAPWSLQIYDVNSATTGREYSRPSLIKQEVLASLKQRRRTLLRSLEVFPSSKADLVQIALTTPSEGYISFASADLRQRLSPALSPFLAGYVAIPDDKAPPSRAFKKLEEALQVFDLPLRRGMACVDLGACPGGWTYVLLKHGCSVSAVDRSALDPSIMKNRNVEFIKADAFSWRPAGPVDLMVCDVIAAPSKTLQLLARWIHERLCRAFCVTIKFKGEPDFATLKDIRELLTGRCRRFQGKQLTSNKNEVTVMGVLTD